MTQDLSTETPSRPTEVRPAETSLLNSGSHSTTNGAMNNSVHNLASGVINGTVNGVMNAPKTTLPSRNHAWKVAGNLFISFRYAWAGLSYAFLTQRNFKIHVLVGSLAIALSFLLHLTSVEIAIISLTSGAVLTTELINTAIESVVDLTVSQTYHELAKIAKDCAAGAVLISALVAIIVAGSLLLPPLWLVVQGFLG